VRVRATTLILAFLACAGLASAQSQIAIYNGASYQLRFPVAPGSYAKVSGNFAGVPTELASTIPLPTQLGGVQVFVNNVAAPLVAVRADEMSFQVPFETATGRTTLRITRGGSNLVEGPIDVLPEAPGVFFDLTDRNALGGILNQQNQYAVQATPARRGQAIQIYCTGLGRTSNQPANGSIPPSGQLATVLNQTVKVLISGVEAQVLFAGHTPNFPSIYQINATVPDRSYISGQVPLVISIGGISSNQVTFWVAQ
jgi:uncharacterized protein (TIGR03437 family)